MHEEGVARKSDLIAFDTIFETFDLFLKDAFKGDYHELVLLIGRLRELA